MTWLEYDPENRQKDASKLLSLVKLPLLSPAVSIIKYLINKFYSIYKENNVIICYKLYYIHTVYSRQY